TRFLVRAYKSDSAVRVTVTEGAVALTTPSATSEYVLRAGTTALVTRKAGIAVAQASDSVSYLAWTSGRLIFDDTPLPEVVADLSRWYGIDVIIADSSLQHVRIYGSLPAAYRDDALAILASLAHARLVRHGSTAALVAMSAHSVSVDPSVVRQ